jgi:hypothetical protein
VFSRGANRDRLISCTEAQMQKMRNHCAKSGKTAHLIAPFDELIPLKGEAERLRALEREWDQPFPQVGVRDLLIQMMMTVRNGLQSSSAKSENRPDAQEAYEPVEMALERYHRGTDRRWPGSYRDRGVGVDASSRSGSVCSESKRRHVEAARRSRQMAKATCGQPSVSAGCPDSPLQDSDIRKRRPSPKTHYAPGRDNRWVGLESRPTRHIPNSRYRSRFEYPGSL